MSLGIVLLVAATAKLVRPSGFVDAVRAYRILPGALVRPAAGLVIAVEAGLAIALLSGAKARGALLGAGALLIAFAGVTALTLRRHGGLHCGCLGGLARIRLGWMSAGADGVIGTLSLGSGLAYDHHAVGAWLSAPREANLALWASAVLLAGIYWLARYAESVIQGVAAAISRE
jgi:hypothetical protein